MGWRLLYLWIRVRVTLYCLWCAMLGKLSLKEQPPKVVINAAHTWGGFMADIGRPRSELSLMGFRCGLLRVANRGYDRKPLR